MILSERLRALREASQLSQEDIAERTGFTQSFVSRVEDGDEVPALVALEKWASALGDPVNELFYATEALPSLPNLPDRLSADEISRGDSQNTAQDQGKKPSRQKPIGPR